jgi:hypothetical protein
MDRIERMLAEARAAGHYGTEPTPHVRLTPDVFGKILFAQWAVRKGRSDFPPREDVIDVLLSNAAQAPHDVTEVMQLEDRITGPTIAQYTDYAQAAQADRLISRYNPDYVRISVEIDSLTGTRLVSQYTEHLPEVRLWVERVIDELIEKTRNQYYERSGRVGGTMGEAS